MTQEMVRWIGAESAVMQTLKRSLAVKKELSLNTELPFNRMIYVPTLTNGHELWAVTTSGSEFPQEELWRGKIGPPCFGCYRCCPTWDKREKTEWHQPCLLLSPDPNVQ